MVFAVDIINVLEILMRRLIKYRIKCHWIQSKFVRFFRSINLDLNVCER